jgi:hypothetical protein
MKADKLSKTTNTAVSKDKKDDAKPSAATNRLDTTSSSTTTKPTSSSPQGVTSSAPDSVQKDGVSNSGAVKSTATAVLNNFDQLDKADGKKDGKIRREAFESAAADSSTPKSYRDLYRRVSQDENLLNVLDVGNGGGLDRKISRADIEKVLANEESGKPQELSINEVASRLRDSSAILDTAKGSGSKDGVISRDDLKAALNNPNLDEKTREAVNAALDNQNYYNALDIGSGRSEGRDGKIGLQDLNAAADRGYLNDKTLAADPAANVENQKTAVTLAKNFSQIDALGKSDGKITANDLTLARDNPNTSPELKATIEQTLANPALLNALDVGSSKGDVDGTITRKDLLGFVADGVHRSNENFAKVDGQYQKFLGEAGKYFDPAKLAEQLAKSPEASRVQAAQASREAAAQNFAELYNTPDFQSTFNSLNDKEKSGVLADVASLSGTKAGGELIDKILDDVEGKAPAGSAPDPLAAFLGNTRGLERGVRTEVVQSATLLAGHRFFKATDPVEGVANLKSLLSKVGGLETDAGRTALASLEEYGKLAKQLETASGADLVRLQAQFDKQRNSLFGSIKGLGEGSSLDNAGRLLSGAAVAFDAYSIASLAADGKLTEDPAKTASLIAGLGQDAALASPALKGLLGSAAGKLPGLSSATATGKVVPVLGAVASFASAFSEFRQGDEVGGAADLLSGAGFTVLAFAGATPVGAIAGAGLVAAGTAIKIGQLIFEHFRESEEDKQNKDYSNFENQVLGEITDGDPAKADYIRDLSKNDQRVIDEYAKRNNLPVYQAFDQLRAGNGDLGKLYDEYFPPMPSDYTAIG